MQRADVRLRESEPPKVTAFILPGVFLVGFLIGAAVGTWRRQG